MAAEDDEAAAAVTHHVAAVMHHVDMLHKDEAAAAAPASVDIPAEFVSVIVANAKSLLVRVKAEADPNNWRTIVNEGHRNKMVLKLYARAAHHTSRSLLRPRIEALTSCMTPEYLKEKEGEVRNLARKIEEDLFRKANSKDEYYAILAQKIFRLNQAASNGLLLA